MQEFVEDIILVTDEEIKRLDFFLKHRCITIKKKKTGFQENELQDLLTFVIPKLCSTNWELAKFHTEYLFPVVEIFTGNMNLSIHLLFSNS